MPLFKFVTDILGVFPDFNSFCGIFAPVSTIKISVTLKFLYSNFKP